MVHLHALTSSPLPERLRGMNSGCSIRPLTPQERFEIEDQVLRRCNRRLALNIGTTSVLVPQNSTRATSTHEYAMLVEFVLSMITVSGFQPVGVVAVFSDAACTDVLHRPSPQVPSGHPVFPMSLSGAAANSWLRRFFQARENTRDKMHIAADRFVRYSRAANTGDSLMDLCISLESLLDSQTEISFRFCTCLAKVAGEKGANAQEVAKLLSNLYDFRSKLVHGADPSKERRKLEPHLQALRKTARVILTNYVLFMSEHSREEWKQHLHTLLFA